MWKMDTRENVWMITEINKATEQWLKIIKEKQEINAAKNERLCERTNEIDDDDDDNKWR